MDKRFLSPSLLSANFYHLAPQLQEIKTAGLSRVHVDVMDGHFVHNISFGGVVLEALPKDETFFYDVHLMVEGTALCIAPYIKAGAHAITFHVEATDDIETLIQQIKTQGCQAGLALKPHTPFEVVQPFLSAIDILLIMTVEPGFSGQSFMKNQLDKITHARSHIDHKEGGSMGCKISVDGGITPETARLCQDAGAHIFVAGTGIFKGDIKANVGRFVQVLR